MSLNTQFVGSALQSLVATDTHEKHTKTMNRTTQITYVVPNNKPTKDAQVLLWLC